MDNNNDNTIHISASHPKRFVPTCPVCGNEHWPKDPSCPGKKGAKAKSKPKIFGRARAKKSQITGNNTDKLQNNKPQVQKPAVTYPSKPIVNPAKDSPASPEVQKAPEIPQTPEIFAKPDFSDKPDIPVPTTIPTEQTYFAQPVEPAEPAEPVHPDHPANESIFSSHKSGYQTEFQQHQHHGGPKVLKIKAGSPEEAASFEEELNRIKLQADQVVLRISKDASHRVEAERTARIQAEQRAKNEAAARIEAQHRLQQEIDQLKALQEEARLAVQADHNQMQQLQAQFTDVTEDTDETAAIMPFENHPVASPSAPTPKDHSTSALLAICARHIMETNIIQVNADDTIADVLDRMLSQDSFYAIVTGEDRTEGIVSRTDLTGPVCEYLKPFIAKWQRPGYDATYNIAIKWIMSRQVNTIDSDASCTAIMKKMRELNMPPLLVIEHEKPIGLVTPFNVFKIRALLKLQADKSANSDRQLIRNLPARISSYLSEINKSKNIPEHQEIK